MKKVFILVLALMLVFPACYASTEYTEYINDGKMTLSGACDEAVLGDIVTLSVISDAFDWQDAETWKTIGDSENVIGYYDVAKADANGKYKFNYFLSREGAYTLYIGSEKFSQPEIKNIVYINEENNKAAISALNLAPDAASIENLLKEGKYTLGIYLELYDKVDLANVSEILFDYYSGGGEKTEGFTDTKNLIYKAFMVDLLSKQDISDIADYWGSTGMENETIGKYYDEDYSSEIAGNISDINISNISEYEDAMIYAIAGTTIEYNDNIGGIKNLLLDFYEKFDIKKKDITSGLASDLAGKSLYSKKDIKDAVSEYIKDKKSSGGGGGGGSSSGSQFSGYTYPQTPAPEKETQTMEVFSDLNTVPWAAEAINALYSKGIISGKGDGIFAPTDAVLREECAKLITEGFKFYVIGDKLTFTDVADDSWYSKYVSRAYHAGVIKGFSETQFGSGYPVTRQDLAVMIYNALMQADVVLSEKNNELVVKDADSVAPYAKEAVDALCRARIISGDQDGFFNPKNSASRAEIAVILYHVINLIN